MRDKRAFYSLHKSRIIATLFATKSQQSHWKLIEISFRIDKKNLKKKEFHQIAIVTVLWLLYNFATSINTFKKWSESKIYEESFVCFGKKKLSKTR